MKRLLDLYETCTDIMKTMGFDFVDAWYHANIAKEQTFFSHNPEWMVERSQDFIAEAGTLNKPWFLYFSATLAHSPPVTVALQDYDCSDTPKGKLNAYETPDDRTTMWPRLEIWDTVMAMEELGDTRLDQDVYLVMWVDQMFGALVDYLKLTGAYDNTYIVLSGDHGVEAKELLYQPGTRIFTFVRYPPLFGKVGPMVMPPEVLDGESYSGDHIKVDFFKLDF